MSTNPVRLQRSRAKGSRLVSPNGLPVRCVTRPGPFGNPFKVGQVCQYGDVPDREWAVRFFDAWMHEPAQAALRERVVRELRGCNVACFCAVGDVCHGDVLLALAAEGAAAE